MFRRKKSANKTPAPKKKRTIKKHKIKKLKPIVLQKFDMDIGISKNLVQNSTVQNPPMKKEKRKNKHRKLQSKIQKLFCDLRSTASTSALNESSISGNNETLDISENCSRISNSENITVINLDDTNNQNPKAQNTIVIADDEDDLIINDKPCTPCKSSSGPTHFSTPINVHNNTKNNNSTIQNFNDAQNTTPVVNSDSFYTIDLTTESINKTDDKQVTVIDLDKTADTQDCTFVSISNSSLSMSGDSDVTVLRRPSTSQTAQKQMRKFAKGIAKMDTIEQGKLLEMIANKIFNGCVVPAKVSIPVTTATDTVEDSYIKEVILGEKATRNSIGSNIYIPERDVKNRTGLRMVVIDGSNVAIGHGRHKYFSVEGLKICIDYFVDRGHAVKAFVPRFRCKMNQSSNPRLLDALERRGLVVYTPSREVEGRTITPYDDRYIIQCAAAFDGVIVSCDFYRDLMGENEKFRYIIKNRLLPFTWVHDSHNIMKDIIMFPKDPLGRNGPTLEQFLRHPK